MQVDGAEAQENDVTCPRPHSQDTHNPSSRSLAPGSHCCHTQRHADAIALGVEEAPDLGEVAVETPVILVHGGLEQEGVTGVEDTGNALLRALDEHARLLRLHVVPHPLVRLVP